LKLWNRVNDLTDIFISLYPSLSLSLFRSFFSRFTKVDLAPGESKTIVFEDLTAKDLEYVGVDSKYILESGDFRLGIGAETDCRSENQAQDWFLNTQDTTSSSVMCMDFSLQLSNDYQPICDNVCGMWSEGICGQQVTDLQTCRETCQRQQWTWDYANCILNYYGESTCTDVNDMQCYDAFGMTSSSSGTSLKKDRQVQQEADHSDNSSVMILTIALVTSFVGLVLGFAITYFYFIRHYLPANANKTVSSNKSSSRMDDQEALLGREQFMDQETL
jgi:hypothetical protein